MAADDVEAFQRESERIHARVAGCAHGIFSMPLDLLSGSELLPICRAFVKRWHPGRRWRWRRVQQIGENPFPPQNRRCFGCVRGQEQDASLPQQPPPVGLAVQDNTPKTWSHDAGNRINTSQPVIQVCVLCADQVENAPVLAENTAQEKTRLLLEIVRESAVE